MRLRIRRRLAHRPASRRRASMRGAPGQPLLWIHPELLPETRPLGSSNGAYRAGEVGGDLGV